MVKKQKKVCKITK